MIILKGTNMLTTIISRFGGIRKMKDFNIGDFLCAFGLFAVSIGLAAVYIYILHPEKAPTLTAYPIRAAEVLEVEEELQEVEDVPEAPVMSDEDILAMVVMAEAGNQDMLGKVAVASVVLNRVDLYGTTVEQVVNEPNQFSYPYYGTVSEECYRAVEIAQENRDLFPEDMLYFRAFKYHDFGIPYEQIGDHFFSRKEVEQ